MTTVTGISMTRIIQASFPDTHVVVQIAVLGHNGARRWEVYHGPAFQENWIGDIVSKDSIKWESQPANGEITTHEYAYLAAEAILKAEANNGK
jgi:hypothetical protein